MKRPISFEDARPKTARAQALAREREMKKTTQKLFEATSEDDFVELMTELLDLRPGMPRFEAALTAWRKLRHF